MPWCRLAFWLLLYIRLLLAVWSALPLPLPSATLLRPRSTSLFRTPDWRDSSPYLPSSCSFLGFLFLLSFHLCAESFSLSLFFLSFFFFLSFNFFASLIILLRWHRWNVATKSIERHETEEKKVLCQVHETIYWFPNEQEAITKRLRYFEFQPTDVILTMEESSANFSEIEPISLFLFLILLLSYFWNI